MGPFKLIESESVWLEELDLTNSTTPNQHGQVSHLSKAGLQFTSRGTRGRRCWKAPTRDPPRENLLVTDQEQSATGTHKLLTIKSKPMSPEGATAKHPNPVNALFYARVRHREADVPYYFLDPIVLDFPIS